MLGLFKSKSKKAKYTYADEDCEYDYDERDDIEAKYQDCLLRWKHCMYKTENWEKLTREELQYLTTEAQAINEEMRMLKQQMKKLGVKPAETEERRYEQLMRKVVRFK